MPDMGRHAASAASAPFYVVSIHISVMVMVESSMVCNKSLVYEHDCFESSKFMLFFRSCTGLCTCTVTVNEQEGNGPIDLRR